MAKKSGAKHKSIRSVSKLSKHVCLLQSSFLRTALPATRRLSESSFDDMIARYQEVIVKPTGSWGGKGVMRVRRLESGGYEVQSGTRKKTFADKSGAYSYVCKKLGNRSGLVQKRIRLASVRGRPFDFRVMIQRHRGKSDWKVTGKLAKVSGRGYIITNIARSHGRVLPASTALARSNVQYASSSAILHQMNKIALSAARQLHRQYRWVHTIGLDMGVDVNGKVWIIEANFRPMKSLFRRLKDRSMYKRICSYS